MLLVNAIEELHVAVRFHFRQQLIWLLQPCAQAHQIIQKYGITGVLHVDSLLQNL